MAILAHCEIKPLIENPEHLPILAELWHEEIRRHWAPNASVAEAQQKLSDHLNNDRLPMAFVAIVNGRAVGMACLRETDGIRPGVTPWLGGLVVDPTCRGNKVGEQLIDAVKEQARKMGYPTLHLLAFDPTIPNWYARLGWHSQGDDELSGHHVAVMSIML